MGSEQTAQAWVNAGKVKSVEEYYQKVGITPEETSEETPEELMESDAVLDEIADIKNKNLCCIFKKINVLFTVLSSLLKFMIMKKLTKKN